MPAFSSLSAQKICFFPQLCIYILNKVCIIMAILEKILVLPHIFPVDAQCRDFLHKMLAKTFLYAKHLKAKFVMQ